jgi:hypothetical protein
VSEDIGAWIREQRFGHIVVQFGLGEVVSLDLFETPNLVCRGFYLPVPEEIRRNVIRGFSERPSGPFPEVELRAVSDVIAELERSTDIRRGEDDQSVFEAYGVGFEMSGALNLVSRQQSGAEVWTGSVSGVGGAGVGQMSFVLERYGSPETILLIVAIFLLLHMDRRADELDEECRRTATETCGERRVKRYRVRRVLVSVNEPGGFSHECDFECV